MNMHASSAKAVGAAKHDPRENVMSNLRGILAAAQTGLAKAQLEQGHAVKKARKKIAQILDTESDAMAKIIQSLGQELVNASWQLEQAINDAKMALAQKSSNPNDDRWDSPAQSARARLSAELSVAERGFQRAQRKNKRKLRQMASKGFELLEDSTHKFSQRVGDLNELLAPAKERIEAAATSTSEYAASESSQGRNSRKTTSSTKDFLRVQDEMALAKKYVDMADVAVDKRFNEAIKHGTLFVQEHTKEVEDNLDRAHKKELKRVQSIRSIGV